MAPRYLVCLRSFLVLTFSVVSDGSCVSKKYSGLLGSRLILWRKHKDTAVQIQKFLQISKCLQELRLIFRTLHLIRLSVSGVTAKNGQSDKFRISILMVLPSLACLLCPGGKVYPLCNIILTIFKIIFYHTYHLIQ
jgi:hypothetical protein